MGKIVVFFSKLVAATILALSFTSCNHSINFGNSITGSENVITQKRTVAAFDKVMVSNALDCEVLLADTQEVTVEADDNLVGGIKTVVENGTLKITSDYNNYINVKSKKVIVRMPKISSLESTSGSSLKSGNTLTGLDIQIKSSSGSSLDVEVEADNINLESSSGSQQNVKGKALKLNTASSSGSHIGAERLIANEVFSQSSSGSSTSVNAAVLLDAKASSGSSINYTGSAKEIRKEESSGGSVSKE